MWDLIILVAVIFLTLFAVWWTLADLQRAKELPEITMVSEGEREVYLQRLACYGYNNGVTWRRTFLAAVVASLLVWYILGDAVSLKLWFLLLLVLFVVFYLMENIISYHITRIVCGKADANFVPV